MRIIRLLSVVLVAFSALAVEANAQQRPGNRQAFHIRVLQTVDTSHLRIWYQLTGPFGGYSSAVEGKPNVSEYSIDLSYDKKPAKTLKAIVYCPGYQMATIDVPSLSAASERVAEVQLKPAASVNLSGKVILPAYLSNEDFKIYIEYLAPWEHEFFGISDGIVATFDIATISLEKDDSFSVSLSDFTLDPVVNGFTKHGEFTFTARNPKTYNILFNLKPAENRGDFYGLQIASQYLYGLRFYPHDK